MTSKKKNRLIRQSNEITKATYKLTLQEKRILAFAFWKVSRGEAKKGVVEIHVDDFARSFDIDRKMAGKILRLASQKLFDRHVTFDHEEHTYHVRWLQMLVTPKESGETGLYTLMLTDAINQMMKNTESAFTRLHLEDIAKLGSVYSVRIYEWLSQFKDTGLVRLSVDDMHERLQLPKSCKNFSVLKRDVLEPALKELEAKKLFKAKYTTENQGRKITHVNVTFKQAA